jgi:hypothetical protein
MCAMIPMFRVRSIAISRGMMTSSPAGACAVGPSLPLFLGAELVER